MVATFLGLPNVEQYTGHSLRRSSATILANTGGNVTDLKWLGGWRSSTVAEGYVEESVENKIQIAKKCLAMQSLALPVQQCEAKLLVTIIQQK
jgi:hypothetical protein